MRNRPERLALPALDADETEVLSFRDRYFNRDSALRNFKLANIARNLWYTYGRQWIEPDTAVLMDGVRGYMFKDLRGDEDLDFPRPVTNYIQPAVTSEVAGLSRRELIPNVISGSKDPRIVAAARVARDILQHKLARQDWPDKRDHFILNDVVCGVAVLKTYWDEVYSNTTLIGSPDALHCPACNLIMANREVPADSLEKVTANREMLKPGDPGMDGMQTDHCPTCPGIPMLPLEVPRELAEAGEDFFGRPLGVLEPKGDTAIKVVSLFDLYPENSGIDVDHAQMNLVGECHVESIDWIEERYPHLSGQIEPEDPALLLQYHPVFGDWMIQGRYEPTLDTNLYGSHARVFEITGQPSFKHPGGRHIVIVGERQFAFNGELVRRVTVEDLKGQPRELTVASVQYTAAGYIRKEKEFYWKALVDDMISPQNRINGIDSQNVGTRERMGTPNLLVESGMELSGPSFQPGYGQARIMTYTANPMVPGAKPEILEGKGNHPSLDTERASVLEDLRVIAGPTDLSLGEAPKNITTTSGLQLLGEQNEKKRAPQERAIVNAFERAWNHLLMLERVMRVEDADYEVQNAEGEWEIKQYNGTAFEGLTKVKVEKQAYVDKTLYVREAVREGQADGLYRLDSPLAIKKILEHRGLPTDVNDEINLQVEHAKKQWIAYLEEKVIPAIDTSLDDPDIHFRVHGEMLRDDDGARLEEEAGWPGILKQIAGWEEELAIAEANDAAAVAFYGGRPTGPQAEQLYMQAQQAHAQMEQVKVQAFQTAQPGTAPPMPAPPPPPPVFLPAALQDRILLVWTKLIEQTGGLNTVMSYGEGEPPVMMEPEEHAAHVQPFLEYRAAVDAYRLLAQRKMQAMMAPAPQTPGAPDASGGATPQLVTPTTQVTNPPNPPNSPSTGG